MIWRSWGGKRSGAVTGEVERASAVTKSGGMANGLGDKVFGSADGLDRIVAENEVAEESGGKGAASAVGGGGIYVLAGEPVDFSRR